MIPDSSQLKGERVLFIGGPKNAALINRLIGNSVFFPANGPNGFVGHVYKKLVPGIYLYKGVIPL